MMVTFVCECEKKALPKTRRVLDAFASRIGTRTWQTVITNEGLGAVKKLLRKTASKSTTVSCRWIRSRSRSELVWVVGNRSKFNPQGSVAGLFHDFGKANQLFQNKLNPNKKGSNHEPYRHEWVSLRLFQDFVGKSKKDGEWLSSLGAVDGWLEYSFVALWNSFYSASEKTVKWQDPRYKVYVNTDENVVQALFAMPSNDNHRIHFCVYHSQFPLAIRSRIEEKLDAVLTRHNAELIWEQDEVKSALSLHFEQNHVFVVLATSVAEVGRDHDYDWAIAESSSMRSLVQLAGRVQRHRKQIPTLENIFILSKNIKALRGIEPAYCRPGFETTERSFFSNDLGQMLKPEHYQQISAIPRIEIPTGKPSKEGKQFLDFVQLEQWALFQRLLGFCKEDNNAKHMWAKQPTWCAEFQQIQPFRQSSPDMTYCLYSESDDEDCYWVRKDGTSIPVTYPATDSITYLPLPVGTGKQAWLSLEPESIYDRLAKRLSVNRKYISKVFGEITLRKDEKNVIDWRYHEVLGVHEAYECSSEDQFLEEGE